MRVRQPRDVMTRPLVHKWHTKERTGGSRDVLGAACEICCMESMESQSRKAKARTVTGSKMNTCCVLSPMRIVIATMMVTGLNRKSFLLVKKPGRQIPPKTLQVGHADETMSRRSECSDGSCFQQYTFHAK